MDKPKKRICKICNGVALRYTVEIFEERVTVVYIRCQECDFSLVEQVKNE